MIGNEFSLSRTFVFFPFFLIGYWLSKERLYQWKGWKVQLSSIGILMAIFLMSMYTPAIHPHWLFGSYAYQDLDVGLMGGVIRMGLYAVAILMTFSLLVLIPHKRYDYTTIGQYTLYVYLLHGVVVQYVREANLLQLDHNLDTIGLAVIAAAIVLFLSSKWVITLTQPLIELKTDKLQNEVRKNKIQATKNHAELEK
ncbi:acyltransferase family protein [Gracilibacillus halophilus]|uniref:acyltransferase family protein n=1 Tax=Gracilibacillus halophilus TaxID=470864 RepID=UPI0003A035F3|nr:acyltransferase family protein [Gracilibacillus halophilus]